MRSLVYIEQQSPRRPCDILAPNMGPEIAKTAKLLKLPFYPKCAKTAKKCAKLKKSKNHQKTALSGLANKVPEGVCVRVFCVYQSVNPGLSGPGALSNLPSLLQLIPARSGPRSLAQLPRGSGRVPSIQAASQRSYKAQESFSVPRDVPRWSPGKMLLQPLGTVPRTEKHMFFNTEKL